MNSITIAERACDNTLTHTDRAPNLIKAVPIADAARNGQNICTSEIGKEKRESPIDHEWVNRASEGCDVFRLLSP